MDWRKFIETNPKIMMGKPVIKGTRITVEMIIEKIAGGESFEQVIEAHPHITVEDIRAAIAFAAENLRADVIYPIPTAA